MNPENPTLLRRGSARLIDALLLAFAGAAWGWLLDYGLVWLVVHALLIYGYFVASDVLLGATLGKRALGLSIESVDGGRPGWGGAAAREAFVLVGAVPFVGPLLAMAAWIAIAIGARNSPLGQGFHDRWGATRVR
ncbi:MAG: RDD family protein [Alphaproteobacteria bacterium]|nr:RDD family protein [Alphaproteobacteria bacterium]